MKTASDILELPADEVPVPAPSPAAAAGLRYGAHVVWQALLLNPEVHQWRDGADHAECHAVQRVALHEQGANVPACPPSKPMRQTGPVEERRIFGSS